MRKLIIITTFFLWIDASAQPVVDGFMRGKGNMDLAPSLTFESYGQYYSELNHKVGGVGRTAISGSLYGAYGISNRIDVQMSIPYVYTQSELSGFQDFSMYFKGALIDHTFEKDGRNVKIMLGAGFKFPMSDYETESVNSIGQADTALDARLVWQCFRTSGFFMMLQVGYTYRLDPVPPSYALAAKAGWAKENYYFDIWYDQQIAVGGNDYQNWRDGDSTLRSSMSFRSFGVSYGKLGVTYYRPWGKKNGVSASASYILWGRNIGQAVGLSLAYVHRFHLGKQ